MPDDFTLELIYLTQLKDTLPEDDELDTAVWAALNCQQAHTYTQNRRNNYFFAGYFFVFIEKEKCFTQIPHKQKQKNIENDNKITPERSLCIHGQLLQNDVIHRSACNRFIA